MIFIDSGAFVARYRKSDDWHAAAKKGWKSLSKTRSPCCTSNLILAEASRLLRPYVGAEQISRLMGTWLQSELMVVLRSNAEDELAAVELMKKYADQQVGFVDGVSFMLMRRHRVTTAFGFDRHFQMAGFKLWPSS
jgi:predicted nucleic acid-binding protein